jgi:hypothetical protein
MEEGPSKAQMTSLLSNRVLGRLELMRIICSRRFTNRSRGEHLTGRGGSSNEFSDYRDYVAGDDVRFVDWNVFARLNRPYIKLFEIEEELHVAILVDASASMLFEDKLLRATQLSEFLTFGDIKRAFNRLFSSGLDIFGVQILGPSEIEPEPAGDSRLVDCETHSTLDISAAADILVIYQEHREAFERELTTLCQQRFGRFASLSSADPLEWVLFDLLRRRGWVV